MFLGAMALGWASVAAYKGFPASRTSFDLTASFGVNLGSELVGHAFCQHTFSELDP